MALKKGQKVYIKRQIPVYGTVLEESPGDQDLPVEKRRYRVKIDADELLFYPGDLEAYSKKSETDEQYEALAQFFAATKRFIQSGSKDTVAFKELTEAGEKAGVIKNPPKR
jgi:hypothetical protein